MLTTTTTTVALILIAFALMRARRLRERHRRAQRMYFQLFYARRAAAGLGTGQVFRKRVTG